jgi:CRISPR-associated protein Csd1
MLLRNAQNHLSRLRKDKPGLAFNLEREIGQIVEKLGTSFPRSLGLEAQGRFAIGYYHETQNRFADRAADPTDNQQQQGEN